MTDKDPNALVDYNVTTRNIPTIEPAEQETDFIPYRGHNQHGVAFHDAKPILPPDTTTDLPMIEAEKEIEIKPIPVRIVTVPDDPSIIVPKTKLRTGTLVIQQSWPATQLVPADSKRTSLQIWAASNTATDYVLLSDKADNVQMVNTAALLYSGQLLTFPLTLPGMHTGAVWVSAINAVGPVSVSFIAVSQ